MYREILPQELKVDKTLGYVYFLDKLHPLASKGVNRVYYHRHLASILSSRWLTSEEVVHHKDGNKVNNNSANLEVLTPEEHSKIHQQERGYLSVEITCPVCEKIFSIPKGSLDKRVTCSTICATKRQVKWEISKEDLEILIWNKSYTDISKEYPISDVGAKKRAKALNCKLPPPYFFNKSAEYRSLERKLLNIPDLSTQQSSKLLA